MVNWWEDIGSAVSNFLSKETYDLNQTIETNVTSGDVTWGTNNTLKAGELQSSLNVDVSCGLDSVGLVTYTNESPSFSFGTNRLGTNTPLFLTLKYPRFEASVKYSKSTEKGDYAVAADGGFDWCSNAIDVTLSGAYTKNRYVVGGFAKVESKSGETKMEDYGGGFQWNRNERQSFSVVTTEQTNVVQLGAQWNELRTNLSAYGQVNWNRQDNGINFALGTDIKLDDQTSLATVFRSGDSNSASVQFTSQLPKNNATGQIALNIDDVFGGLNKDSTTLGWKLAFGV